MRSQEVHAKVQELRNRKVHQLIRTTVHNPSFVEVDSDQILENVLCPVCNHRSLVSVTTKAEADLANQLTRELYDKKVEQWKAGGMKTTKPRMGKTSSQILGCVCYMRDFIGNTDGSGCFKCKKIQGNVNKTLDTRQVNTFTNYSIYLPQFSISNFMFFLC